MLAAFAAALPLATLLGLGTSPAAADRYVIDGSDLDWGPEDLIAEGTRAPTEPNVSIDLTGLSAADNLTSWFFRLSFLTLAPGANASFALYLFGPDDGSPAPPEPMGFAVGLPPGAPLRYVLYLELDPSFPAGSKVVFHDGIAWKNRTLFELGVSAARNESAGFVELSAARDSFTFLEAGSAAAAVLAPAGAAARHMVDGLPEAAGTPPGTLGGRARFFDYSFRPPIAFTALGLSDPFARAGDNVTIFVELTNEGPRNVSGLSAQVFIDGSPLTAADGLTLLGGGGTAVVSFEWQAVAGLHNVTARSFPGGAARSLQLVVEAAAPELTVGAVTVRPATPAPGEAFAVDVQVQNTGTAPSTGGSLLLKDGTLVLDSEALPDLAAGGAAQVTFQARIARSGPVSLRVEIDGANGANATRTTEITLASPQPPFGLSTPVLVALGLAGVAAAAWFLTPRLSALRRGKGPEPPPPP